MEHFPISQTITTSRLLTRNPQNQKPQEYENCLFFAETNQLWKNIVGRDPISSQTVESLNCVWRKRGLLARGNKNCTYKEFKGRCLAHSLQSSKAKKGFSHSFSAFSKKKKKITAFLSFVPKSQPSLTNPDVTCLWYKSRPWHVQNSPSSSLLSLRKK